MNALVPQMSAGERKELCLIVRRREKYEKTQAEQRSAELLANFEQQLATIYEFDTDATWQAAHDDAEKIIEEAEAKIAARCIDLGEHCRTPIGSLGAGAVGPRVF